MRYVKIPRPVKLTAVPANEKGEHPSLSLLELIRDLLGSRAEWRENGDAVESYIGVCEKLEAAAEGEYAPLTDAEHEKLAAVLRAFEPAPAFALPYMRLMRAVTSAPKSLPESSEAPKA